MSNKNILKVGIIFMIGNAIGLGALVSYLIFVVL
jgi:hypothetical protein